MKRLLLLTAIITLALPGCSDNPLLRAPKITDAAENTATTGLAEISAPRTIMAKGSVTVTDGLYLGENAPSATSYGSAISEAVAKASISLRQPDDLSLSDYARQINRATGVPVSVLDETADLKTSLITDGSEPLTSVLDQLTRSTGSHWYALGAQVFIVRSLTEIVAIPPSMSAGDENDRKQQGNDEAQSLQQAFGLSNSDIHVIPSLGIITIRDPNGQAPLIASLLKERLKRYSRQAAVYLEITSFDEEDLQQLDLSAQLAIKSLINSQPAYLGASAAGMAGGTAPTLPTGVTAPGTVTASLAALRQLDHSVITYTIRRVLQSGNETVLRRGDDITYVARATSGTTTSTGVTTGPALETDTINEGVDGTIKASVLGPDKVNVSFDFTLKLLKSLDVFTSADTSVQVPRTSKSQYTQSLEMRNGQSMVIDAFLQTYTKRHNASADPTLTLPNDISADIHRIIVVVQLTARILPNEGIRFAEDVTE